MKLMSSVKVLMIQLIWVEELRTWKIICRQMNNLSLFGYHKNKNVNKLRYLHVHMCMYIGNRKSSRIFQLSSIHLATLQTGSIKSGWKSIWFPNLHYWKGYTYIGDVLISVNKCPTPSLGLLTMNVPRHYPPSPLHFVHNHRKLPIVAMMIASSLLYIIHLYP